jgi:hypothetical protein
MFIMKSLVAFIVFGLIALAVIAIIVINVMYHNMKRMRENVEDFIYRRGRSRYEAKEKNPIGDDYFKSARTVKRTTRTTYRDKDGNVHVETTYSDDSGKNKTTRRTTTSGNVTIIDERPADKKIFEKGDDEYVEFEEVK